MLIFPSQVQKIIAGLLLAAVLIPSISFVTNKTLLGGGLGDVPVANAVLATLPQQIIELAELVLIYLELVLSYVLQGLQYIQEKYTAMVQGMSLALQQWIQNVFKVMLEYFKLKLLDMLSTQIVNWITNGALGGPQYVTNWSNFLGQASKDALNIAINEVDRAAGGLICTPFAAQLRNLLRVNIPSIGLYGIPGFQYQLTCSLDTIVQNINDFYTDFSQGGWQGYISLLQPNNNYYGNMIAILDFEQGLAFSRQRAAQNEGTSAQGFLSVKRCKVYNQDSDGNQMDCREYEVTTPGNALAGTVTSAVTNRFGYIQGMDQIASIIAVLADSVLNKLIGVGVNGLMGYAAANPSPAYLPPDGNFTNCDAMPPGPQKDACLLEQDSHRPGATISSDKRQVDPGEEFTVFWSSVNAVTCTGTNYPVIGGNSASTTSTSTTAVFSTDGQTSGSASSTIAEDTTYLVVCSNDSGLAGSATTTVFLTTSSTIPVF